MNYSQKLKDPRWQKKRLEVMERAGFKCQTCGESTKTLNVHHVNYRKGAEPWEYDLGDLACVCEDCHSEIEGLIKSFRVLVSQTNPKLVRPILDAIIGPIIGTTEIIHPDPTVEAGIALRSAEQSLRLGRVMRFLKEVRVISGPGTHEYEAFRETIDLLISE